MKKIVVLMLVLSIFSLGLPINTPAAQQEYTNTQEYTNPMEPGEETPPPSKPKVMSLFNSAVITAAVSVLGFIALAASVDSGNATSSTAPTTHH